MRGGADVIQWRDKSASDSEFLTTAQLLRRATRKQGRLFIVNDRVKVALQVHADGVHLGHEDLPIRSARSLVGDSMLIGRSTHSLAEARSAEEEGADYLGVGPIFPTPTKPEYQPVGVELIRQVASVIRIPWVAIGSIDLKTVPLVLSAGAHRVAVVRAVVAAPDPESAARVIRQQIILQKRE